MISVQSKAPEFSLKDQDGHEHRLSEYKGKWVILYFYPKDDTPGCTLEACSFRDASSVLTEKGIVVFGVSKDSVASHKKFQDKYKLPFALLSDESKEMLISYEAWGKKKFMGREYDGIFRITYVIDPEGIIRKVYPKVNVSDHAKEILKDIEALE